MVFTHCESQHSLCPKLPSTRERGRIRGSLFLRHPVWHSSVSASLVLPPEPHQPSSSFLNRYAVSCLWPWLRLFCLPGAQFHTPVFTRVIPAYPHVTACPLESSLSDSPRLGKAPLSSDSPHHPGDHPGCNWFPVCASPKHVLSGKGPCLICLGISGPQI